MLKWDFLFLLSWQLGQYQQRWHQDSRQGLLSPGIISKAMLCTDADTEPTSLQNPLGSGEQGMLSLYVITQEELVNQVSFTPRTGTWGKASVQFSELQTEWLFFLFFSFLFGTAFVVKEWLTDFRAGLWQAVSQKKKQTEPTALKDASWQYCVQW